MNIGDFNVYKSRFKIRAKTSIYLNDNNDEIIVHYNDKVSDLPKIPNKNSVLHYDMVFNDKNYKDIADYLLDKAFKENKEKTNKEIFGYSNKFKLNEIKDVKLKNILCFTIWNVFESIMFFILCMIPFLYIYFKSLLIYNFNGSNFSGLFLIALFLILFILWANTIKVMEISFIDKNKKRVIIPVYGYMFFILNKNYKMKIHSTYRKIKSLIKY